MSKSAAVEFQTRAWLAGNSRPPYWDGPWIQPKPASNTLWRQALASSTSASSCSLVFSANSETLSVPSPQPVFSATFGVAFCSRKLSASSRKSASEIMVGKVAPHREW